MSSMSIEVFFLTVTLNNSLEGKCDLSHLQNYYCYSQLSIFVIFAIAM